MDEKTDASIEANFKKPPFGGDRKMNLTFVAFKDGAGVMFKDHTTLGFDTNGNCFMGQLDDESRITKKIEIK